MVVTIISVLSIILLVACDQISKYLISSSFMIEQSKTIIPGFFEFKYIHNPGISFGMFKDMRWFIVAVTSIVVVALLSYLVLYKPKSMLLKIAVILICAGGIGNLIDRIAYGYVVDFLLFSFNWFPFVFNVADFFVSAGGAFLFIYLILDIMKKPAQDAVKEENEEVNFNSSKQ